MLYNLSDELQKKQFLARTSLLAKKGGLVELCLRTNRSLSQNRYLHSILGYFAVRYGETLDYVKIKFFKETVNSHLFKVERYNEIRGKYTTLRSTASLTVEEMNTAIDRFRDWSSKEAGIYLPGPDDLAAIRAIEIETYKNRQYI